MGLPRDSRMRKPGEFAAVRRDGRACSGRLLTVAFLEKPELDGPRFGFTLTRKIGIAVARNKLRRRFREIARMAEGEISVRALIVTIARPAAAAAEFSELQREWRWAVKKLGLLSAKKATAPAAPDTATP